KMNAITNKQFDETARVDDSYVTKLEIARRLHRSCRTVEKWMRGGRLPFLKIGRSVLFHWPTVERHLNETYQIRHAHRQPHRTRSHSNARASSACSPNEI